jgi:hypothetical protein
MKGFWSEMKVVYPQCTTSLASTPCLASASVVLPSEYGLEGVLGSNGVSILFLSTACALPADESPYSSYVPSD